MDRSPVHPSMGGQALHSLYSSGSPSLQKASPGLNSRAFAAALRLFSYLAPRPGRDPGPSHLIIPIRPLYGHGNQVAGLNPQYFFIIARLTNVLSMNLSDQNALELLQQDPVKGFKVLFDKYWDILYAIAVTKLPSSEEARDTVQEVFLSLWTSRGSIRDEASLFPWLSTCLRNRVYNHYARNKTRQQFIRDMEGRFTDAANNVAEKLASKELKALIEEAISQLPPKMQLVFRMNKEQQLTPTEIAKSLSLSVQTVKNQLYRANDQVKTYIAARIEPSILIIILLTMLDKK